MLRFVQMQKKNEWPDARLTKISTNGGLLINLTKDPESRAVMIQHSKMKLLDPICLTIRDAIEQIKQVDKEDPQSVIVLHENGKFTICKVLLSHQLLTDNSLINL